MKKFLCNDIDILCPCMMAFEIEYQQRINEVTPFTFWLSYLALKRFRSFLQYSCRLAFCNRKSIIFFRCILFKIEFRQMVKHKALVGNDGFIFWAPNSGFPVQVLVPHRFAKSSTLGTAGFPLQSRARLW